MPIRYAPIVGALLTLEQAQALVLARADVRPSEAVPVQVAAGDVVVGAGVRLGPAQVGALAASGVAAVTCAPRPRVAILATGSELAAPGADLEPGQIYESNGLMLAAALAAVGADIDALPV